MMEERKQGLWRRLSDSLTKSRDNFSYQLKTVFTGARLTDDDWDRLEEVLITADVGVEATTSIVEHLRQLVVERKVFDSGELAALLREQLAAELDSGTNGAGLDTLRSPCLILVVGVNGTGKTTTIAKIAHVLKERRESVTLVAADTFRAAAIEQLEEWSKKTGVNIIKHQRGSDPAAVVFDAAQSLRAGRYGFGVIDTAGRLQTHVNLMEELKKIKRVAVREGGEKIKVLTVLVMDATTGQNGISQARIFNEALDLDGLILTKLDGTAKGGIVIAVRKQLAIPIMALGVGEGIDDLAPFEPAEFCQALIASG